jgi:hypothetical protein
MAQPTVERAARTGPAAVLMALLWGGLACSTDSAIDLGGNDEAPGEPVSLPCSAVSYATPPGGFNYYDATLSRTLPWPDGVANVVGVASDRTGLWLLSATWNNPNVSLLHYDLTTGETSPRLPIQVRGLFTARGTGAVALEVDSLYFWVGLSGNDTSIVRIGRPPFDDEIANVLNRLPGVPGAGASDFAWLGHDLVVATEAETIDAFAPLPSWSRRRLRYRPSDTALDATLAICGDTLAKGGTALGADLYGPQPNPDPKAKATGSIGASGGSGPSTHGSIGFYGDQLVVADTGGLTIYDISVRPPAPSQ